MHNLSKLLKPQHLSPKATGGKSERTITGRSNCNVKPQPRDSLLTRAHTQLRIARTNETKPISRLSSLSLTLRSLSLSLYIYIYIYRRLGGVVGVSQPLTGKSFRFVRACDAKLCVSARRMRFRLLGLQTDLQRRRRARRPRDFVVFCFKNRTTPLRNRHFWLKTVKNVRASRVFIIRTVKNVRASRVFIL